MRVCERAQAAYYSTSQTEVRALRRDVESRRTSHGRVKGKTARGKMIDLCCDKAELFHITQSSNRKALLCFSRKTEGKKGLAAEQKIYICWGGNGVKRGV